MPVQTDNHNQSKISCGWVIAVLLVSFVCVVFLFSLTILLLRGLGAVLITSDSLEQADAAVVLGGGDSTRLDEAARLYDEEWIDYLILMETGASIEDLDTQYSSILRFAAIQRGIPANAILIGEQQVASTVDEARSTLKIMNARGFNRLIVITDPYHTLRARLIFRDIFPTNSMQVMIHPVRNHWYRSTNWWMQMKGWKFTLLEYVKLSAYLLGFD